MKIISENKCFEGVQGVYSHASTATGTDMTFGLFTPAQAKVGPVPVLWYLSGLTCTHENAMTKAGAQIWAAQRGIALVFPDTSPRGEAVADDPRDDLGQGAGFYLNATQPPWAPHYQMFDYVAQDLPDLLFSEFAFDRARQAITGHSMGGHGALTLAMNLPGRYRSVSAFAPMFHPTGVDWGREKMTAYLGPDEATWARHDAALLMAKHGFDGPILIDTGTDDEHLDLLRPQTLLTPICERHQAVIFRLQPGYDHSYFFVASFMQDHVDFHADALFS